MFSQNIFIYFNEHKICRKLFILVLFIQLIFSVNLFYFISYEKYNLCDDTCQLA